MKVAYPVNPSYAWLKQWKRAGRPARGSALDEFLRSTWLTQSRFVASYGVMALGFGYLAPQNFIMLDFCTCFVIVVVIRLVALAMSKKTAMKQAIANSQVGTMAVFEANSDGVNIGTQKGIDRYDWRNVHDWRESEMLVMIFVLRKNVYALPRERFESEADLTELRQLLTENVGANEYPHRSPAIFSRPVSQ